MQDFLQSELDAGDFCNPMSGSSRKQQPGFSKKFAQKGWIGITWPKEYGGQGRTYVEKAILVEEYMKVQAPVAYHHLSDRQISGGGGGGGVTPFGVSVGRRNILPRFVKAEPGMRFCLLFSEPNAGSDLVNVSTTALKDGENYIITGQKVWTSQATCRTMAGCSHDNMGQWVHDTYRVRNSSCR